jgi:hypothetical protein
MLHPGNPLGNRIQMLVSICESNRIFSSSRDLVPFRHTHYYSVCDYSICEERARNEIGLVLRSPSNEYHVTQARCLEYSRHTMQCFCGKTIQRCSSFV